MLSQSANPESEAAAARRRKVRKGTHSCWECRRRKIRCQYASGDDAVCIGCRARGSACRSQEFTDEVVAPAPPERKVAQRLDRLEAMMERLMEHVLTEPAGSKAGSSTGGDASQPASSPPAKEPRKGPHFCLITGEPIPGSDEHFNAGYVDRDSTASVEGACPSAAEREKYDMDVLETSKAEDTPVATLLGIQDTLSRSASNNNNNVSPNAADAAANGKNGSPTRGSPGSGSSGSGDHPGTNVASTPGSAATDYTAATSHIAETSAKYRHLSSVLHSMFPSQENINIIANPSCAFHVISMFHSKHDIDEGRCQKPASLTFVPPATTHPAVLARNLLQLVLCMQQMAACYVMQNKLKMKERLPETISRIMGLVAHTVTTDDDLVGNLEGIQCLVLMGQAQANAGHLRKAWLTFRRAMSLAQLMGLDRGNMRALKSCCPRIDPSRRPTPAAIWYRINACDRSVSMLLGLRAGSPSDEDTSFGPSADTDTPFEQLGKAHTTLAGRIIERNHSRASADETYAFTKAIDAELTAAATKGFDPSWWDLPSHDPYTTPEFILNEVSRTILQVNHYGMMILLHIPYMLRAKYPGATGRAIAAGRFEVGVPLPDCTPDIGIGYSQWMCMQSSRAVLRRFINFRLVVSTAFSCRHIDYTSLIAAMTLVLGYLGPRPPASSPPRTHYYFDHHLHLDRTMIEKVMNRMAEIGKSNNDKLASESAATIRKLLPILDMVERKADDMPTVPTINNDGSDDLQLPIVTSGEPFGESTVTSPVRLNVPYLGTVNINPNAATSMGLNTPSPSFMHQQSATLQQSDSPFDSSGSGSLLSPDSGPIPTPMGDSVLGWNGTQVGSHMGLESAVPAGTDLSTMLVDFDTIVDESGVFALGPNADFPDTTGALDDWVMQGVDTTYWSLLNGNSMTFGGQP